MKTIAGLIVLFFVITSCVPARLGFDDRERFEESPKILTEGDRYFIRFRYPVEEKAMHFAMITRSRIKNDTLLFFIETSTSSGYMRGVVQFEEVITPRKIELIEQRLVFWEGENRVLTPLTVEPAWDFDSKRVFKKH